MVKKIWEKCSWCFGSGKESPGSAHPCGQCWGEGGKWTEKGGNVSSGCMIAGLVVGSATLLSFGVGISKAFAAAGVM